MNKKVHIGARKEITLTDKYYKASGGEASIYVHGDLAIKLYHDPQKALSKAKISELSKINNGQVIVPKELVSDTGGNIIGYATHYIDNAEPLLKLFTRTFKDQNGIDNQMIAGLVKEMQFVTNDIHQAHCLVVDYNELNILAKILTYTIQPFYIDTDSYATPSFKATAIMDSVRDRRVSRISNGHIAYDPDALSDWYSWGILAFWLYTNIHPFRGSHPNYKPRDKGKQMDDGISVFHNGVRVPPSVNNFNVIPPRHLAWFKDVFKDNHRSVPPLADSIAPVAVPTQAIIINSTKQIDVQQVAAYPGTVLKLLQFLGVNYAVTKTHVYAKDREAMDVSKAKKASLCAATDGTVIVATFSGATVTFTELNRQIVIGTMGATGMFSRNGSIYTVTNGRLVENSFSAMGNRIIHRPAQLENISSFGATIYRGCIIQDLLGKKYLTIPYARGRSFSKYIQELDGYRIVEAKSEYTVTVIVAEKGGKFYRFIIVFNRDFNSFDVRIVPDIAYDIINFTVTGGGLCMLLASPTELELFLSNNQIEVLSDPPFDATMKLFSTHDGIYFINNNSVHLIKKK